MTSTPALVITFLALCVLLFEGAPIGATLALVGTFGIFALLGDFSAPLGLMSTVTISMTTSFTFVVVPMFVLMGELAAVGGISQELFDAAYKTVGRLPGGLAVATTVACAAFAAVTGSSLSETVAMSKIALPEMDRHNYKRSLSTGVIASAGTFAMMIPPSIMMVVYAIFADQSVGRCLVAGVFPGLTTAVVFSILILVRCHFDPSLGPRGEAFPWKERLSSLINMSPFFIILAGILAGILLGVWTPTEGGAGGVLLVFVVSLIRRRLNRQVVLAALWSTMISTATVFAVVIGCMIYSKFIALSGVTDSLLAWLSTANLSNSGVFIMVVILYLVLGCFLEGISMLALTMPVMVPLIATMGWDGVWFGVIVVKLIEIAQITPPVGINLFALKAASPDTPMSVILRGVAPFIPCEIAVLALLWFWPQIALFLPNIMISAR